MMWKIFFGVCEMIYQNIEFFNIAEIKDGRLSRFPFGVVDRMQVPVFGEDGKQTDIYTGHRGNALAMTGAELRFVAQARSAAVRLACDGPLRVTVYCGDFYLSSALYPAGEHRVSFERPAAADGVARERCGRFSPFVWRVCLDGICNVRFLGLDAEGEVRPPRENEAPRCKLLAYGSSITQGFVTPYARLNYISAAAEALGIDILNKGIAGGCFCEKETAEYLCGETFDAAYIEAGTNIADRPFDVIEERLGGLLDRLCGAFPDKKIFLATPFPAFSDVSASAPFYKENFAKTRKVISERAEKYPNAVLIDAHALADKDYYLSADILHPSDYGHVMIGLNLAKALSPYIGKR